MNNILKITSDEIFFELPHSCFIKIITRMNYKKIDVNLLKEFILQCPVLTFSVLRFANSAEVGFSSKIKLISESLTLLDPIVILNFIFSFKEFPDIKNKFSICNKISKVKNRIIEWLNCNNKKELIVKKEEILILLSLFKFYDILYAKYIYKYKDLSFPENVEREIFKLLKHYNFPTEYINFFSAEISIKYKYIKKLFILSFKYIYLPFDEYNKIVTLEIST